MVPARLELSSYTEMVTKVMIAVEVGVVAGLVKF